MSEKIQRTTFGVMTSHVISSSTLFPLFWLIAGSIAKAMLITQDMINETLANALYYTVMLLFFYFGTKYSLYYINKKISVNFPKQSGEQSIVLFTILVIASNYGLFYFEESINFMRIFFSLLLIYMFSVMTKKYFDSLEETEYLECTFIGQTIVLLANLSMFITILVPAAIISGINPFAKYLLTIIAFFVGLKTQLLNKIFVSFFYKEGEPKPIKYALIVLAITLPINIGLYFIVINYFEKFIL